MCFVRMHGCGCVGIWVHGCSLLPRTSFHFEVRMEVGTGLKTSVGVGIDVCVGVVSVYMTEKTTPTSSGHRYDLLHWKFSAHLFKLAIQNEYLICISQLRAQGSCISCRRISIQFFPLRYRFMQQME